MMERIPYATGWMLVDIDTLRKRYGADMFRVTHDGNIEVLMIGEEGAEWIDITELDEIPPERH